MNQSAREYELKILQKAIAWELDRQNLSLTDEGLASLQEQQEKLAEEIAAAIQRQSGHSVELGLVKEAIAGKIREIETQLARQKQAIAFALARQNIPANEEGIALLKAQGKTLARKIAAAIASQTAVLETILSETWRCTQ